MPQLVRTEFQIISIILSVCLCSTLSSAWMRSELMTWVRKASIIGVELLDQQSAAFRRLPEQLAPCLGEQHELAIEDLEETQAEQKTKAEIAASEAAKQKRIKSATASASPAR